MFPRVFFLLVLLLLPVKYGIALRRIDDTFKSEKSQWPNRYLTSQIVSLRSGALNGPIRRNERHAPNLKRNDDNLQQNLERSESSVKHSRDLPVVKALLVHRRISFPQIIRLWSAFLFTYSLLESLRTSGVPYNEAVVSTLKENGMTLILSGGKFPQRDCLKVTPLDEYFAKKICQSENNILPPKYLPCPIPLLGLISSVVLNIGILTLFPKWFVEWKVFMDYKRFDTNTNLSNGDMKMIEACLFHEKENNADDTVDHFYQSRFVNHLRNYRNESGEPLCTGISLLVELPAQEREMQRDGKKEEILLLYKSEYGDHPAPFFVEMGQRRIYVDLQLQNGRVLAKSIDGGPTFYQQEDVSTLIGRGKDGLASHDMYEYSRRRYGAYNEVSLPLPTVTDAFVARVSTPLAVMQLLCRILTALEENFVPSLLNILVILWQHYTNAKKSVVSVMELSAEIKSNVDGSSEQLFWTLRPGNAEKKRDWMLVSGQHLLPGDVFYLPSMDFLMPVDALILEGSCFAKEAAITGESVPQAKVAIEADKSKRSGQDFLSIDSKHRNSILFAGTDVISYSDWGQGLVTQKIPKKVRKSSSLVKCIALRTGSYSSKGEIVRALSKSSSYAGGISTLQNDKDAIRLIGVLSACAAIACFSLFIPSNGSVTKKSSGFRRFIQCTRIAIASIPSELPIALNHAVYSCASVLRKESDVVCSDPGHLLTASQIDMIVFDKTGTLTSDTQSLTRIVNFSRCAVDPMSTVILAGCHSLLSINSTSPLIGDPLDIAGLQYSNWTFNSGTMSSVSSDRSAKLWQIKTFPFDPCRRMSSSLVLLKGGHGTMRLWKLVKGSAESIKPLLRNDGSNFNEDEYLEEYDRLAKILETEGNRCISLAAQDVSNSTIVKQLFPDGLPTAHNLMSTNEKKLFMRGLSQARIRAKTYLPIEKFEELGQLTFAGFACFKTSVRASTPRVIREVRNSGTDVCMLTGDSAAAALSVAKEAGFFDAGICKKVAVLDVNESHELQWTILSYNRSEVFHHRRFTKESIKRLVAKQQSGRYAIMITGDGVEALASSINDYEKPSNYMLQNLDKVTIFARTSPHIKQQVLTALKVQCKRKVMMCGDGVNDISAMKTADVSAALLSGYGKENSGGQQAVDLENERRKARLKSRKIGKLRTPRHDLGMETHQRLRMKLGALMKENGESELSFNTITQLIKDEYSRAVALKKGGAAAARILQQEELLRKSMNSNDEEQILVKSHDDEDVDSIKPGEASLAAPFTFLRPCIDGADSIIRSGIAAAAFSLSSHRSIALNCFMACCNLASLYHDGFRYGKYMWNVELALIMALDNAQFEVSSLPRPRIQPVRPSATIFHPSVALSVVLQGIVHLFVLHQGVRGANLLQYSHNLNHQDKASSKGLYIRLASSSASSTPFSSSNSIKPSNSGGPTQGGNLLGRTPFQPNYVTNIIFLLSIFQNTMISMLNHCGYPFHGSLLESKSYCIWSLVSIIFVIVLATEVQPQWNQFLQLAPMVTKSPNPSTTSSSSHTNGFFVTYILALLLVDGILAYTSDRLCIRFCNPDLWTSLQERAAASDGRQYRMLFQTHKSKSANVTSPIVVVEEIASAADLEENLLGIERSTNRIMIRNMVMISLLWLLLSTFYSFSNTAVVPIT